MDFHEIKCNMEFSNFTCEWRNKPNSFFNNMCKVATFEFIVPKMESSSISVGSIKALMVGFKKWKKATNNDNKVLLSYSTTIYFNFAYSAFLAFTYSYNASKAHNMLAL
jgi:hypothetical protein